MTVLTLGLKAKNFKFINYSLVGTAHAQCVDCCEQKPFYCPTSVLRGSERETLGTRLANVARLDHNNMLLRATR